MIRKKSLFGIVIVMFMCVVMAAVATLSISANEQSPTNGNGVWLEVCCGSQCGGDYCVGTGTYSCCK